MDSQVVGLEGTLKAPTPLECIKLLSRILSKWPSTWMPLMTGDLYMSQPSQPEVPLQPRSQFLGFTPGIPPRNSKFRPPTPIHREGYLSSKTLHFVIKFVLLYDPTIPLLGWRKLSLYSLYIWRKLILKDTHTPVFIATPFTTAKTWK